MEKTAPKNTQADRWRRFAREVAFLGAILLVQFAARSSFADHYVIPSGSMEPTLGIGDRILVNRMAYGLRVPFTRVVVAGAEVPGRGDVVVFDSPVDGERLVKRLVAIPGDTLEVRHGQPIVNGRVLPWAVSSGAACEDVEIDGERRHRLGLLYGGGDDLPPTRIPEGYAFAMGDNRGNSADSRVWGLLPLANVQGRAVAVYWEGGHGLAWHRLSGDECLPATRSP